MKREWKPGDVALVRVGTGDWEYGLLREDAEWICQHIGPRHAWEEVQAHPVVVIDPDSAEDVERVARAMSNMGSFNPDHLADALRSLVTPPKPDEPQGVFAQVRDDEGKRWVRLSGGSWQCEDGSQVGGYFLVSAVEVLS